MKRIGLAFAGMTGGFILGGFVGWLIGAAWLELIEVPYAERELEFWQRASYLCGAYNALALLAIPGALIGALAGMIYGASEKALARFSALSQSGGML